MIPARTLKSQTLPAPVNGVNFRDSLVTMDQTYSPWSDNICYETQYCRVRNGMPFYSYISTYISNSNFPGVIGTYQDTIWGISKDATDGNYKAWDLTTSGSHTPSATINFFNSSFKWFPVTFNGYIMFFESLTPGVGTQGAKYNGSWTAIAYTYSFASLSPVGAVAYKGRLYIIDKNTLNYEYTDIAAIGGATHGVNLTSIFSNGGAFSWVATFSTTDGVSNTSYIAFGSTTGEVLFYSGDYPGSSSWTIVGRSIIGKPVVVYPLSYSQVIQYQNDALVITSTGLVSLRNLFQLGQQAALNKTVSSAIDDYWIRLAKAQNTAGLSTWWSGAFYPDAKKIVIGTNGFIDKSGTFIPTKSTFFVFNIITGSWGIYDTQIVGSGVASFSYSNNKLFYNNYSSGIFQFEADNIFTDGTSVPGGSSTYSFELDSSWNAYAGQSANQKVLGYEPIIDSDFSASAPNYGIKIATDFGVQTTVQQNCSIHTGINIELFSVGIEGTFAQHQIIGNTTAASTTGLKYYAINYYYEDGGNNI